MEQRPDQLLRPDGLTQPVTVSKHELIELTTGPNTDSDIYLADPAKVSIKPCGEPSGGFQKVTVIVGNESREMYLARE